MAARRSRRPARYALLRPHTARIAKVAEYPTHVNGAYMDDPERIALFDGRRGRPRT